MIKKYMLYLFHCTETTNRRDVIDLLEKNEKARVLDLGCDDGSFTVELGDKIGTKKLFGIDIVSERLQVAKQKGVNVVRSDLNDKLPFKDGFFDVVHSNQVIEHLHDVDRFTEEISRVLRPGGYAIFSTENLSSWHNIFALLFGYQAFSQHISYKYRIGNPFSPHYEGSFNLISWTHIKIFTMYGLKEFLKAHKFKIVKSRGAGYYPFPPFISKSLVKLDSRHAHYIVVKARKKA